MFTGIVEEVGKIVAAQPHSLVVSASKVTEGMKLGGSIAVNGVCLTVTKFDNKTFSVDIMPETLKRTNLGLLKSGGSVNLERPLALGGELGGHLVQGHIDETGKISAIKAIEGALIIQFNASSALMRYIVEKGFIAVDGISLTVVERSTSSFSVSVVDYTRENTIMGDRRVGDLVNLEVDIMAKYAEQYNQAKNTGVTMKLLGEKGFLS